MLLAHFAASGPGALELPGWAVAYAAFAVSVIVILLSRNRHVPTPRPPSPASCVDDPQRTASAAARRRSRPMFVARVVATLLFWIGTAFCWFGPATITQNLAPLALIGVLWSMGGWVSPMFGWCWEALDPFAVFARTRQGDAPGKEVASDDTAWLPARFPAWAPIPVFATWVVVWVAWVAGDEPRHLAVWLTLYGLAMSIIAWRGGSEALHAWNPLPSTLDLTAPITRPRAARVRIRSRAVRLRTGLIAAMLLGALAANRISVSKPFILHVSAHGDLATTCATFALFAVISACLWAIWLVPDHLVASARGEKGSLPLAALLGPIAGTVLIAQALPVGLIEIQNLAVLASDPFAQGWNLFGTVYWVVSPRPISPFTRSLIQVGVVLVGHAASLYAIGHVATMRFADGSTSPAARHRCWRAALPAMGVIVISSIVWTIVVLG